MPNKPTTQTDWRSRFQEQFYYARTNVDDNDYSIIKDRQDKLPAGIEQIEAFIANERKLVLEEVKALVEAHKSIPGFVSQTEVETTHFVLNMLIKALEKLERKDD